MPSVQYSSTAAFSDVEVWLLEQCYHTSAIVFGRENGRVAYANTVSEHDDGVCKSIVGCYTGDFWRHGIVWCLDEKDFLARADVSSLVLTSTA